MNIRKLRHFFENILNSINHSLTLLLSALTLYFIVDQYKKLRQANTGTFLSFCTFVLP